MAKALTQLALTAAVRTGGAENPLRTSLQMLEFPCSNVRKTVKQKDVQKCEELEHPPIDTPLT